MTKWLVYLFFFGFGYQLPQAMDCGLGIKSEAYLSPSSWNSLLPKTRNTDLSKGFEFALQNHPEIQKLKARLGDGRDLSFHFSNPLEYQMNSDRFSNGEATQAILLSKILRFLFPKALMGRNEPTRKRYQIDIIDSAEKPEWLLPGVKVTWDFILKHPHFQMAILKPLSPGVITVNSKELRKKLGLPSNARIASIYSALDSSAERPRMLANLLFEHHLADIIIITGPESHLSGWKMVEAPAGDFKFGSIIINRTYGSLPYIHGLSDFAVISGAGNIFEPLNAKVPTFYFVDPPLYSHEIWAGLTEFANSMRGMLVHSEQDIISRLSGNNPLLAPNMPSYLAFNKNGTTAVDQFVEELNFIFDQQDIRRSSEQ